MSTSISEWLNGLGLGQYAATFEQNEVEFHILSEINDTDLRELGVNALGHRKIIQRAIKELYPETSQAKLSALQLTNEATESTDPGEGDITAWSRTPGERKPVTLLFADMVGSTALTEKLDAEEAHALLYQATRQMCKAIEKNQGTVCRVMGDGVMAMFGAPVASERHALEACKAALEMQRRVERYSGSLEQSHALKIQIRVGLHSGEVVMLEVGDDPGKPEYDASGPTVAQAARMEQAAEPGTILMTENTRVLAGNWIETTDKSTVSVKGLSDPVRVFGLDKVRSASDPQEIKTLRPIVGRTSELVQFRGLLQVARETGHGQSLLIRGEPGIGKTRLVEELMVLAQQDGFRSFMALVLDFGTGKGQEAIPSLVRGFLGIVAGSGKRKREQALTRAQKAGITLPEERVFLNDLLDLGQPLELRTLYDAMEARTRVTGKHRTVAQILLRLAASQPVLLVIEGIHWADTETLDYLSYLTTTMTECPALMLLTSRLEDDPVGIDWRARAGEHPTVTWDLGPLRNDESLQLATGFVGGKDRFVQQCVERAEGNPLFLEQLLLVAGEGSLETVPDSIKSLVLARIDQLSGDDKLALRAASVLGQRFEIETLCHLVARPNYRCKSLLEHHLVRPDGAQYMFTHALIQGGIYASLLNNQRHELHRLAADWYASRDDILHAEHLDRAGDSAAADAYLRAATKQSELYRPERALQLVRRGIEVAPEAECFALSCLQGELLRIHGDIPESIDAYRSAAEVAGGDIGRCNAWIGVAAGLATTGAHQEAIEMLDRAREIASEQNLLLELAKIHRIQGNVFFYRGQIEACLAANKLSLQFARDAESVDVEARALSGLANAEYNRGRFISALRYFDRCIELAREHGFGRVIAANLSMRSYVICWQNDIEAAITGYREAADQAVQTQDPRAEMLALMIGGSFWALVGNFDAGEKWLKSSLKIIRRIGSQLFEGVCFYLLGRFALLRGNRDEARKLAQKGIAILRASESGMTFGGPIALGILALAAGDPSQCHKALDEAEAILAKGSVGHNYLNFYEDAMEACLQIQDWDEVDRYATALVDYTLPEPLPRSNFFIARGRALAAYGRGNRNEETFSELRQLHAEAEKTGLVVALQALDQALSTAD